MEEMQHDEVELFDDYLEFVMTYAYIVLYAAAFPFGTTITCFFIVIEMKSDIFKLERNSRRPHAKRVHDIGSWETVLAVLTFWAVFTNIWLMSLASQQIDTLVPYLKDKKDFGVESISCMFGIEHVMVALVFVYYMIFDGQPRWVKIFQRRFIHRQHINRKNKELQERKDERTPK